MSLEKPTVGASTRLASMTINALYPVFIEYKRALNENVISQGLFYPDWLTDHQGEFACAGFRRNPLAGRSILVVVSWRIILNLTVRSPEVINVVIAIITAPGD
jgi:hypothetical protein